ncbi:MAG: hypothetical protein OXE40_00925 [Gammaproteobacteria bacterium]|nr:hypothetical protein [Gammaproteobacteria bacterium]
MSLDVMGVLDSALVGVLDRTLDRFFLDRCWTVDDLRPTVGSRGAYVTVIHGWPSSGQAAIRHHGDMTLLD